MLSPETLTKVRLPDLLGLVFFIIFIYLFIILAARGLC